DSEHPVVVEHYRGYAPPIDVQRSVVRLLQEVPAQYLAGLREIVLTNSASLSHGRRHRGRKYRQAEVRGLYHQASTGGAAWIEILVDNTLREVPASYLRVGSFATGSSARCSTTRSATTFTTSPARSSGSERRSPTTGPAACSDR